MMNKFEYKYVFNINVRSARPEEGLTEGRNVKDSAPMPIYLHKIYHNYRVLKH